MSNIRNFSGTANELYETFSAVYKEFNACTPDRWEYTYYLEALEVSLDSDDCWINDQSILAVADNRLILSAWKGTGHDDFLFLLDTLYKYPDVRVQPMGVYFHDLGFLMNRRSLQQYHASQVSSIRLDITKHSRANLQEYFHWDQS
jgi:hypothetical protein